MLSGIMLNMDFIIFISALPLVMTNNHQVTLDVGLLSMKKSATGSKSAIP